MPEDPTVQNPGTAQLNQEAAAQQQQQSAQWLQQNRPDMVNQQRSAEQAAAANLAYRSGQYEVPSYVSRAQQLNSQYTQEQILDAQQEQAKHDMAFHPQECGLQRDQFLWI